MPIAALWPLAFAFVSALAIGAWLKMREGDRIERMAKQDRDIQFIAGERDTDDRVKLLQAYVAARAQPTNLERECADILDAACHGHSPGCAYCACGFSKEAKGVRSLAPQLALRASAVEKRIKDKLLSEGWAPPNVSIETILERTD